MCLSLPVCMWLEKILELSGGVAIACVSMLCLFASVLRDDLAFFVSSPLGGFGAVLSAWRVSLQKLGVLGETVQ